MYGSRGHGLIVSWITKNADKSNLAFDRLFPSFFGESTTTLN